MSNELDYAIQEHFDNLCEELKDEDYTVLDENEAIIVTDAKIICKLCGNIIARLE